MLCNEHVEKSKMLSPENAFNFLFVIENIEIKTLQDAALELICNKFEGMIFTPAFLSLSFGVDDDEIWTLMI